MPFDQACQRLAESIEVDVAPEPPNGWNVISGEIRLQLMEEPEAGLGVGGGEGQAVLGPVARDRLGRGDATSSIGIFALPQLGHPIR
jgi:hypothetical protein